MKKTMLAFSICNGPFSIEAWVVRTIKRSARVRREHKTKALWTSPRFMVASESSTTTTGCSVSIRVPSLPGGYIKLIGFDADGYAQHQQFRQKAAAVQLCSPVYVLVYAPKYFHGCEFR